MKHVAFLYYEGHDHAKITVKAMRIGHSNINFSQLHSCRKKTSWNSVYGTKEDPLYEHSV